MDNKTYKKYGKELRGRKKDKIYQQISKRKVRRDKLDIKDQLNELT